MKRIIISLVFTIIAAVLAFAQEAQNTRNSADQTLRSTGTVNPSTLGLEMSIPLGGYQGRGITLPIGLNYSSKLWRFETKAVRVTRHGEGAVGGEGDLPEIGNTWTYVYPKYAEDSASGWISTISQPYVQYTGWATPFNCIGTPVATYPSVGPDCGPGPFSYVKRISVHLGDASYELRDGDAPVTYDPNDPDKFNGVYKSVDGSGVKYVEDNNASPATYRLYMPDGSFYDLSSTLGTQSIEDQSSVRRATRLTDANGNYVTFNSPNVPNENYPNGSITDTLGRTFPVVIPREAPTVPEDPGYLDQEFAFPGIDSNTPYRFRWKRLADAFTPNAGYALHYRGATNLDIERPTGYSPVLFGGGLMHEGCGYDVLKTLWDPNPGGGGDPAAYIFNPAVLTEITLPNGATYEFSYNEYGEIERIEYPAGGHEEYTYEPVASLAQLEKPFQESNRGVVERKIYESNGAAPSTWEYDADSADWQYRTTITAPDGSKVERYMHRGVPPLNCEEHDAEEFPQNQRGLWWGYDNVLAGRPFDEKTFDSSSAHHLVQRTLTQWDRAQNGHVLMTRDPERPVQFNPRVIWTETRTYDGTAGVAAATRLEYYHDGFEAAGSPLNVRYKKEYGFTVLSDGNLSPGETLSNAEVSLNDPTSGQTPVRVTETTFKIDMAYLDRNFLRLPIEVKVTDGANPPNLKAKSQTTYDEPACLVSDTPTGTVPGWGTPEPSPSPVVRGLPTTTTSCDYVQSNACSHSISTSVKYNQFGSPRFNIDGNGNVSEIQYTDNYSDSTDRHTYALPTLTISAVPDASGTYGSNEPIETRTTYDFDTNLPTTIKNLNVLANQNDDATTTMEYVDPLRRPTKVTAPNGQQTITEYGTPGSGGQYSTGQRFVKVRSQIDSTSWKEALTWFDGLMRNVRSQSVDDDGDVVALTCYDNMGRVSKSSNPFRGYTSQDCSTTTGTEWTTNTFDDAGRLWKVTTPDSAIVTTTYGVATSGSQIGTVTTVADQAGKLRRSITNALRQLIRVDEPTASPSPGPTPLGPIDTPIQPTYYGYDLLNNLTVVKQGGTFSAPEQTRTFTYDSLSRLKQAVNPESGTMNYSYDSNGNLSSKIDARNITTNYVYDALNRVTQRSYATPNPTPLPSQYQNTPTVTYYYDNVTNAKGKLTKVTSSVSTTEYTSFDISGRVTGHKQTTDGQEYTTGYTYNLAGGLVDETYPSGRVVRNVLDGNGDLAVVESKKNASSGFWHYADSITYTASGAVSSLQLGNGHWESTTFNSRLQPMQIALGTTPAATNLLKLDYTYSTSGNHDSNGNILTQTITVPTVGQSNGFTAVQAYTYDSLSRIKDATETVGSSQTWKQEFSYDRYGNRNFVTGTGHTTTIPSGCPTAICNPSFDTSTNKFASGQGWAYDAAGSVRTDANGNTFIYDGENKQVVVKNSSGVTLGEYWFDGEGKRVKKKAYDSSGNPTEETVFIYDAAGKSIAEYSTNVASAENAKVAYLSNDHLGSPRINTDANGAVTSRHDYHPFGEEIVTSQRITGLNYGADAVRKQFTGYERDGETGLDFAEARMLNFNTGRFVSVDPLLASGKPSNPQTFNRYPYVINNPLATTDPTGKDPGIYFDHSGNYLGWDGKYDDKVYFATPTRQTNNSTYIDVNSISSTTLEAVQRAAESAVSLTPGTDNDTVQRLSGAASATASEGVAGMLKGAGNFLINNTTAGVLGLAPNIPYSNDAQASYGHATEMGLGLGTAVAGGAVTPVSAVSVVPETVSAPAVSAPAAAVNGNSLSSLRPTWGYRLFHEDGTFLKNGITSQPVAEARYTKAFMFDKNMEKFPFPNRLAARIWERHQNTVNPGPLNIRR